MMAYVGVVNLSASTAAQKAGQVTGPKEIIAPLSAQKGLTKKLGSGTGSSRRRSRDTTSS